jgi:hypothetical protein
MMTCITLQLANNRCYTITKRYAFKEIIMIISF